MTVSRLGTDAWPADEHQRNRPKAFVAASAITRLNPRQICRRFPQLNRSLEIFPRVCKNTPWCHPSEVPVCNSYGLILLASVISLLSGCNIGEEWQNEIHLPAGDAARGEALFASVGCVRCHVVGDAEFEGGAEAGAVRVRLGSKTGRRMSYSQLVTSVVNPSHRLAPQYFSENITKDGESLMANYNDALTVTQLTDVVAYLQTHYEDVLRPGFQYPSYEYDAGGDARE
jgi:mono/diheme cytochrome c family protein